jgi:hypothetical protein
MEVIEGGFKKGDWQSDREAYSEEDIKDFNDVLRKLAKDVHPGWLKLLWEPKEPSQPLKCVK